MVRIQKTSQGFLSQAHHIAELHSESGRLCSGRIGIFCKTRRQQEIPDESDEKTIAAAPTNSADRLVEQPVSPLQRGGARA